MADWIQEMDERCSEVQWCWSENLGSASCNRIYSTRMAFHITVAQELEDGTPDDDELDGSGDEYEEIWIFCS